MRTEIISSWHRSALHGLRPERVDVPYEPDLVDGDRLARASEPVLEEVGDSLATSAITVVLADADARIVDRRAVDRQLRTDLDRIHLAPGFRYSEDGVGTNAIGTALAQGRPSIVAGDEHFAEAFCKTVCAAAPIVDPRTGCLVGVVDLTAVADNDASLMLAVAAGAAREVELRLAEDVAGEERLLLDRFREARRHTKGALVSLNRHRMIANGAARRILHPADEELLWDWATRSFRGQGVPASTIRLTNGDTLAIRGDPVMDGARVVGALIWLGSSPPNDPPRPRPVSGWESLTETEQTVARLVAQGMTNRQAAAQLFVSRHTVGAHLRQIFRKLQINSRVQLAHLVAANVVVQPTNGRAS
jgi:transcriptional regulator of acetoin/glycerol metabolism/DNA-binding CsgD family transcriptional regulator